MRYDQGLELSFMYLFQKSTQGNQYEDEYTIKVGKNADLYSFQAQLR